MVVFSACVWRAGPLNKKKSKNEHSEGGQKRQKRLRWSGQGGFLFVRFWCERTVTVRSHQKRTKRKMIPEVIHCVLGARRTKREKRNRRTRVD